MKDYMPHYLNLFNYPLHASSLLIWGAVVACIFPQTLQAQSYSRSFSYSYAPNKCTSYRTAAPSASPACLEEGIRTIKIVLSEDGMFTVKRTDRSTGAVLVITQEGVYQKSEGRIVFTLQREQDNAGHIRLSTRQETVQYELVEAGIHLRGGDTLIWGPGATEREGVFR